MSDREARTYLWRSETFIRCPSFNRYAKARLTTEPPLYEVTGIPEPILDRVVIRALKNTTFLPVRGWDWISVRFDTIKDLPEGSIISGQQRPPLRPDYLVWEEADGG